MAIESALTSAAPPIDRPALLLRCIGKTNLLERVLATFVRQVSADLELLENAIAKSQISEIARLAHRMRGTSLSVSATDFAVIALALEDVAESATLEEVRRFTIQLQDEYRRIVNFVGSTESELTKC